MNSRAFTLVELLIVILIMAVLAGVVLPYIQRYVEEARISRAKTDLDEIKNALVRYENTQNRLYDIATIRNLVGSYMNKMMTDPWGMEYVVNSEFSACYSTGPDAVDGSGDEIRVYFRPPLAVSRVFWRDNNKDMMVNEGDALQIRFTRPLRRNPGDGPTTTIVADGDDFSYSNGAPVADYLALAPVDISADRMAVIMTFGPGSNPGFKPEVDSLQARVGNRICDGEGIPCLADQPTLIKIH